MSVESINLNTEKLPNQKEALKKFDINGALAGLGEISKDNVAFTGETYKVGLEFTDWQENGVGDLSGEKVTKEVAFIFDNAFSGLNISQTLA